MRYQREIESLNRFAPDLLVPGVSPPAQVDLARQLQESDARARERKQERDAKWAKRAQRKRERQARRRGR